MASYDRRFLVPYLQDVCSAEMLCSRLEKEIVQCNNNIQWFAKATNKKIDDPSYPQETDYIPENDYFGIMLFAIGLVGAVILYAIPVIGPIIGIGFFLFFGLGSLGNFIGQNSEKKKHTESFSKT